MKRSNLSHGCIVILGLLVSAGCQPSPVPAATPTEAVSEAATQAAPKAEGTSTMDLTVVPTEAGELKVTPLQHASTLLTWGEKVVYLDPIKKAIDPVTASGTKLPAADLILITDIHGDHLDADAVNSLRKEGTLVVAPQAVVDAAEGKLDNVMVLANGESQQFFDGTFEVEGTPMYNLVRKRDNGELFHTKGRGNGYIIRFGGKVVYFSGDTECIPEMKALKDIDVAFVCMNLPFTMPVEEAAECVQAFKPTILYPYHYRGQDPKKLDKLLGDASTTEVRYLNWYPNAK